MINPGLEHGDTIGVVGEHADGTHCELIAIAAEQVFPLDDDLSFEEAAAFPLVYETAYRMLVTKAAVQEGEWVLIWGIGGGVGTAAFEICRALGLQTIVTSGSDWKLERARDWGADVAVNHADGDVVAAVKEATGKGVHVVVESVGEATWARSLAAVRPGGSRHGVRGDERSRTRRPSCTASGGSSSPCSAPRWERAKTSSAPTTSSAPAARACTSTACFRSPRRRPHTSGSRRASSWARSSCRSEA